MLRTNLYSLAVAIGPLALRVMAGAGAQVNACVYYNNPIDKPLYANFTVGGSGDNCMLYKGGDALNIKIESQGLTCASVGYVEAKSSSSGGDTCASDTSIWTLSFVAGGDIKKSGSTQSEWQWKFGYGNQVDLRNYNRGTKVCGTQVYCNAEKVNWERGTAGPIYFVFAPEQQGIMQPSMQCSFAEQFVDAAVERSRKATQPERFVFTSQGDDLWRFSEN